MRRGEIYRTRERVAERGAKPGFYVVDGDILAFNPAVIAQPLLEFHFWFRWPGA